MNTLSVSADTAQMIVDYVLEEISLWNYTTEQKHLHTLERIPKNIISPSTNNLDNMTAK